MSAQMTVDGRAIPIGTVRLHFQYFLDDGPPHAWIDLVADSSNARLGGIAINCLDVGDVPALADLEGRTLSFGNTEAVHGAELGDSVCWLPGDDTLEVESLRIAFGRVDSGALPIALDARCFDHHGRTGIAVRVVATIDLGTT
ncbi:MAG: hypothetical protein IPK33_03760 [Gemmatimonadetes bacterium]|nr:hypothetical protein [Gemmatimonadota bacterium]MBK9409329.1 hypothetical protein [Gemmatimonadota bacterium]